MSGPRRQSPRTISMSVLKTLINWGIPREFSETNPCVHVPKLDVTRREPARGQCGPEELWVPLHADLKGALKSWDGSPYVRTPKGERYTPDRFRAAWTRLMNDTPAGKIRKEGFTFHRLRASSVEKLREAGCGDREIEAITGMSPTMVTRIASSPTRGDLQRRW
jgi:integrase